MSTKKTSDTQSKSTLSFDPVSKAMYNQLIGAAGNYTMGQINNPFGNPFYKMGLGQSQRGAQLSANQGMNAFLQNLRVNGISGRAGNAFQMAQQNKLGRNALTLMSGANVGNVMSALQRQQQNAMMGMSYQPLMTGESSTSHAQEQTSGLGTWLPQLAGGLMQGVLGMATRGVTDPLAGKGLGAATGNMGAVNQMAGSPFAPFNPSFPGFPKNPFQP